MKKTTTCRFRSLAAVGVALGCIPGTASAQDTLQVGQQGQQPRVHVVSEGETLWSIATRYLGDPMLWPEIYRLNTLVVEDPHWIFPGEELALAPRDVTAVAQPGRPVTEREPVEETEQAVPVPQPEQQEAMPPPVDAPPPPPPTEQAPTVFLRERDPGGALARLGAEAFRYRAVRRGEFYAAGFLTEGQELPWARVLGAVGKPTLARLETTSNARLNDEIRVVAPAGAEYRVGDSLLVARMGRGVGGGWGNVVRPSGIAVVTHVAAERAIARLVRQFDRVTDGQVALPLEPFNDPGDLVPVPVQNGMEGAVIALRDRPAVPGQQDVVFIDLGRSDGVALGDVFEVIRSVPQPEGDMTWEQISVLQVVHVRELSASAVLITINELGTEPGAKVRLLRKMPS